MILSRFMREIDYDSLEVEGRIIQAVHNDVQMWYPTQHHHRLWEYAMAQQAITRRFGDNAKLKVADFGCGAGFLGPIMYWLGHKIYLYEIWTFGDDNEKFMYEQLDRITAHTHPDGSFKMVNRPLGALTESDSNFDVGFCISTLEHIANYQCAFRDLCKAIKPGGLMFLTTDAAEDEKDHYVCAHLRAGKMFTIRTYFELMKIGQEEGFRLMDRTADWTWDEGCRLVFDYGFGSLAMVKDA